MDQKPREDGFKPKYRHFHPHDRVWIKNPFEHDVVYQVADEYNRPFKYRLPAGKVSELPGGAIATLGVKAIVDELIQNTPSDVLLMWDERTRSKHEETVIQAVKSTKLRTDSANPGEINLGTAADEAELEEEDFEEPEVDTFGDLNKPIEAEPAPAPQVSAQLPADAEQGLRDVVAASLPRTNTVTEPQ